MGLLKGLFLDCSRDVIYNNNVGMSVLSVAGRNETEMSEFERHEP